MIIADKHIKEISIDSITVLNPRSRNKRIFTEVITSIDDVGLKRPVTVTPRPDGLGYRLVCGQGRLEACKALGETHIAAIVIQASEEDCFVMSLVENLARRQHSPAELLHNIGALRSRGYTTAEIAGKTGFSVEYVSTICYLLDHGEKRLLVGVERGIIPPSIAIEITRAKDDDVRDALIDAYEQKKLPGDQVLAIRKIIELRRSTGKGTMRVRENASTKRVTASTLVRSYQKEVERKKQLIEKAKFVETRMLFVTESLRKLLADQRFRSLLRDQHLPVPRTINLRIEQKEASYESARASRV